MWLHKRSTNLSDYICGYISGQTIMSGYLTALIFKTANKITHVTAHNYVAHICREGSLTIPQ